MVMQPGNKIVIGCGEYYLGKFRKILESYAASGRTPVVFSEPQIRKESPGKTHYWIFNFYGDNFILEMPVPPQDKDRIYEFLNEVAIVMNTLSNSIEATIHPGGRVEI
ncbi:MAG: hypothetical protein KJ990_12690 [Proteobacteria bacterium]|nr:hypothetical protein [Pseudomonadota bacterium]MBU1648205.1 hypothetical protein [Pseudomonadota bacterium]